MFTVNAPMLVQVYMTGLSNSSTNKSTFRKMFLSLFLSVAVIGHHYQ